jgi:flagellar hook-associated protein 2
MPTLSAPGVGSGLDVNSLVSQLMAVERQPLAVLDSRQAGYKSKLSAYGQISGALSALQTAAQALSTPDKFTAFKTSVSDDKVLTATAGTAAVAGSYSVEVSALAQAQMLTRGGFASSSEVVGSGTLKIEIGSYGAGGFTPNPNRTATDITIDPTKQTLTDIRAAINASGAGVSATIVNGVAGSQLFITANDPGLANSIRISTTDADGNNSDDAGLSKLAFDKGGSANLTEAKPAADALLKINGIDVVSSTNVVSGALDGLTLNLQKTNAGAPITVAVAKDNAPTKTKIETFVKAYNDLNKLVRDLTVSDPTARTAGPLSGDSAARSVQTQLRALFNAPVSGAAGVSRLPDVGITFQRDGSLAIDSSKLEAALNDPNKQVGALFVEANGVKGYAAQLAGAIDGMIGVDGVISSRTDGINHSLRDIDKRRTVMEDRLIETEKRLRAQYTALDAALARMQGLSSYLTQQLGALNNTK